MTCALFPKCLQELSAGELMEACAAAGIDTPTVMVRDGYWVTEADAETSLPAFLRTAEAYGMRPDYAQTGLNMARLEEDNRLLRILAANGIRQVRMGMLDKEVVPDYRELDDWFRRAAARAEAAGRANGIRCVIQIHGNLYPHNATAAWRLVKDLDPRYIGIKLDPGNNLNFEGFERFDYQIRLLREYITALGVKDVAIERRPGCATGGKGWSRRFVPITEGMADYDLILRELLRVGFNGPMVLMPFYEAGDRQALLRMIGEEAAFLRAAEARAREAAV